MKFVFLLLFFLPSALVVAQNKPGTELHIKKTRGTITIDGNLDEPDWQQAQVADNWYLNYPVDTAAAPFQTEARVTFNDQFFYLSFVCYDDESPDLINSLRRDFDYDRNDNVGMNLGPYKDGINGFFFVLTPKGVQMEGTISGSGTSMDSYNIYWDNKWYSKVIRHKNKWVAEMAIPFKSFRYKSGVKEWDIVFDRSDKKRNHKSCWIETPIQYGTGSFAYSGKLIWDDPIPPSHTNISIIPFVAGNSSVDNDANPKSKTSGLQAGFDAKVSVTPSLNLDLTVNPDFSQVEVDQQVINLTRFEFMFPERRIFFLENSDLYDKAGFPDSRIFFSRRVGLVKDATGLYRRIPIAYGARLSGSLNKKWRVNVLNMQTKENLPIGLPTQNYSVATVMRNFWKQSSISLTYVDKESFGVGLADTAKYFHETVFQNVLANGKNVKKRNVFNRVLDADLEMLSRDNKWYASAYAAKSFDAFNSKQDVAEGTYFQYSVRHLNIFTGQSFVQQNFNAEAGYVPSHLVYPGQYTYFGGVSLKFYPAHSSIVVMGPTASVNQVYIPGGILSDRNYSLGYTFSFLNTATLLVTGNYIFQRMTNSFNPIDATRFTTFNNGEKYHWENISATFQSDTRDLVNYTVQTTYGGFYNGTNWNVNGQLNFRYQPYGNVSLRVDYNDLRLPGTYGREKLFLIGPRFDVTFTDKIFLTTYFQYNKLLDNVNLNARFQWRYKPASDFFIVYTENYLPETFATRNRALVFKLTYWFNL